VGQRVAVSMASNFLPLLLLTVVPVCAVLAGHVRAPHLMVSDIIASGPLYKAFYAFGFTYCAYGSNTIWTEVMRHVKARAPALRREADRFLIVLHWVVLPCLLLLSTFSYDHEEPEHGLDGSGRQPRSWAEGIPRDAGALASWLVHVLSTSLFFFGAAVCGGIYVRQIMPHLKDKGLVHPRDLAWSRVACGGLVYGVFITAIVRVLHMFHDQHLWCWPLAVFEVALILLCIVVNTMGTLQLLSELDKDEPAIDFKEAFLL